MWKSRDARKTSSLRPTFTSTMDSKGQGSILGRTFIPRGNTTASGVLCGPGGGMGEASLSFYRPLAPPPRIPLASGLSPYIQELLPTSFPVIGTPAEYNFDPITGLPLKVLTPSTYSMPSQPWDVSFLTTSPWVTGLSDLPGLNQEEHPLVVGSLSCSSQVVAGRRIPTVTVCPLLLLRQSCWHHPIWLPGLAPPVATRQEGMCVGLSGNTHTHNQAEHWLELE